MKKKLFYIIQASIVLFAAAAFYSCNDTIENEMDERVRGVSVSPNPMTVGQPVIISGPDFKNATAIVFPGGVSVTDFTRSGDFQLNAVVPNGAAREGNISVTLPSGAFLIPYPVTIFQTGDLRVETKDVNPETGYYRVGPNDELIIRGEGLGAITEVIMPGGTSISSMNFDKKTETYIVITIPMGGFDTKAVEPLKIINKNGVVLYSVNRLDWSGEGFVPAELLPFCGRSFKVWTWSDQSPQFGNGGYNSSPGPAWWTPSVDDQYGSAGHGMGAKMAFYLPNKMILTLTDGTILSGKFTVDMTKGVGTWSKGKLEITSGDDALSIIGGTEGTYNGSYRLVPKLFDIVKLTNAEMTLAFQYPAETGTANFYVYKVKEDEGEGSGGGAVTVPDELKPFAGEGSKVWEWDDSFDNCYGMGDGWDEFPGWWAGPKGGKEFRPDEGIGATMTFTYAGKGNLKLTKTKTDDSSESGSWDANMAARYAGWGRTIGKLTTGKVTVLSGRGDANTDVFEYWILNMTGDKMTLGISEMEDGWSFDNEGWGQANLWLFKAKK